MVLNELLICYVGQIIFETLTEYGQKVINLKIVIFL